MNERELIEKKCVDYAILRGYLVRKLDTAGGKGWPDAAFWGPNDHFIVEFKLPVTGKLGSKQEKNIATLNSYGHCAYVIDDVDTFKELLNARMRAAQ